MIYTITFNPSLDYIMHVETFEIGETNRSKGEELYVGGKGFNVSTILHNLGLETTAVGFIGGFSGNHIEKLLKAKGFHTHLIHLQEGNSRINVKLKGQYETEINGAGPFISNAELNEFYTFLNQLQDSDILVLAGSIPPSLPINTYEHIMKPLQHKKIQIIVDATKESLLRVLPYHPFLIKPNINELEELFQVSIDNIKEVIRYASKLKDMGALNVLVSMGKEGAILLDENSNVYQCDSAKGTLINSVGSGDSMVAGFIAGYLMHQDYAKAMCLGSAAGGATAFSKDLADKQSIMKLYHDMTANKL